MTRLFDARQDDMAVLAALHAASFEEAWDAPAIAALLATPGAFAVWTVDGFILVRAAGGEAEILTLAVSPPARGQGLGRSLVTHAAAHAVTLGAQTLFLEVADANRPALALYAGLGFLQVGRRTGYYRGRDAAVMKVPLPLSPTRAVAWPAKRASDVSSTACTVRLPARNWPRGKSLRRCCATRTGCPGRVPRFAGPDENGNCSLMLFLPDRS